jgi:hypothetical protein
MANERFSEPLDPDGKLSAEAIAKLQAALVKLRKNCPSCGERAYSVADRLYSMPMIEVGRAASFSLMMACAIVSCENCGHLMPYNAKKLGLYELLPPEKIDG